MGEGWWLVGLRAAGVSWLLGLAAWLYDRQITAWERRGWHEGYVAFLVAGGVLGVLGAGLFVVWPLGPAARLAVGVVAGLFVPAGLPMILGSVGRHVRRRETQAADLTEGARAILRQTER